MESGDGADREGAKERHPWTDEFVVLVLMRELTVRKERGDPPCTVHSLSAIRGMPTQRDQRIRKLLDALAEKGYVEKHPVGDRVGYAMSAKGLTWWREHRQVLGFFGEIRERPVDP